MTYQFSMNIYVLDKNGSPVPGAKVTVSANGRPKASGTSRGYVNTPVKLRFNSDVASVSLKAEYPEQPPIEKTVSSNERDVTINFTGVEMPQSENGRDRFAAENWAALIFGIVMLVVLFLSPLILPRELPAFLAALYPKIVLTILSLAAAGFAAALTGFVLLQIGGKDSSYAIRAGGALAVFLIVFFWNPAGV